MNHHRHVIREAVVATLAAGGTAAGTRVYDHPADPRLTLPAITVVDVGETQSADSMPADAGRPVERGLLLEISAEVKQVSNYARSRDQLLADIERLLATNPISGVKSITPAGYVPVPPDPQGGGEVPVAIGRQRFRVLYYTTQGDPSSTL